MEVEGWILTYRRPDLDEVCIAGPFPDQEAAVAYGDGLPPDRYDKNVDYGTLSITPKPC